HPPKRSGGLPPAGTRQDRSGGAIATRSGSGEGGGMARLELKRDPAPSSADRSGTRSEFQSRACGELVLLEAREAEHGLVVEERRPAARERHGGAAREQRPV